MTWISFFSNLEKLYNELSSKINNSSAWFDNIENLKREIELVYMNLDRGKMMRRKEIDIEWMCLLNKIRTFYQNNPSED